MASPLAAVSRRVRSWFSKEGELSSPAPEPPPSEPTGPLAVRVGVVTDTGLQREHNEDRPLVQPLGGVPLDEDEGVFDLSDGGLLVAVCDGMGGAVAGEIASALVVETLSRRAGERASDGGSGELEGWLVEGVEESNRRVLERVDDDPSLEGMGSTVTSAVLAETGMTLAHVGDSRGYHLRGSELRQVTEDHSFVAKLVSMGKITEEEARDHSQRNLLLQAIGAGGDVDVEHTTWTLGVGDRILLCSDGLSNLVSDVELKEVLRRDEGPASQCRTLVSLANERGGHDNITVVIAHVESGS